MIVAAFGALPVGNPAAAGFFISETRLCAGPGAALERGNVSLANIRP